MPPSFDQAKLLEDLKLWWDDQVSDSDPFKPKLPADGSIFDVIPEIDSHAALTSLLTIEKHVGVELPPKLLKRGGYSSFEEMAGHLVPRVREFVESELLKKGKSAA